MHQLSPISLINADLKIVAAYLVADNVLRHLHILSETNKIPPSCGLLFLDAEKAFDRLEWSYLWRVLKHFKFGDYFIYMIKVLYANPSAWVCVGDGQSDLFNIKQGVKQGDPLSPLLFSLSIEPLAHLIKSCYQIVPITLGSTSLSISQYADDTLVYMADVQNSLPVVLKTLEHFGYFSGYKVNLLKSALLLINADQSKVAIPPQVVVKEEVLCLGIRISSSLASSLASKTNYSLALNKMEEDIKRWKQLPAAIPACVSVVKMNILPRINFISSMIPLAPPPV